MKKILVLIPVLLLCLGLAACGDTDSDDTQSGYETVMDMEFLDGMWSIDGTSKLYFDSEEMYLAVSSQFEDVAYEFTLLDQDTMRWGGEFDFYQKMA